MKPWSMPAWWRSMKLPPALAHRCKYRNHRLRWLELQRVRNNLAALESFLRAQFKASTKQNSWPNLNDSIGRAGPNPEPWGDHRQPAAPTQNAKHLRSDNPRDHVCTCSNAAAKSSCIKSYGALDFPWNHRGPGGTSEHSNPASGPIRPKVLRTTTSSTSIQFPALEWRKGASMCVTGNNN